MENRNILTKKENILVFGLIILAIVLTRLLPHPVNFAPVAAVSLFAGAHMTGRSKYFIPLLIMFLSDLFLGFHSTMIFVYGAFTLSVFLGRYLKQTNFYKTTTLTLFSSVLFFLITNFGVWLMNSMYEKSFFGLMQCYLMGIPFFRNTVLGDLMYTYAFFYGYRFISQYFRMKVVPNKAS
ncbi:MAG TPA: DUF6580 family putative transport protein [Candidatus Nitrosocosmicus sp.]|nr:DUF6580 family putative transport protein [Candidatus Nitrosocosmicus sp.]